MATDNNIKHFSAADIEKYHKGLLSNKEMHDLEKAAMEDPFLADALEGYSVPGVMAINDIADLKKRLGDKVEEEKAKVVPMNSGRRAGFPWFRAAAAVVIIGGAGLLANQFLFKNKATDEIAEVKNVPATIKAADSVKPETVSKSADAGNLSSETKQASGTANATTATIENNAATGAVGTFSNVATTDKVIDTKEEKVTTNNPAPVAAETVPTKAPGTGAEVITSGKVVNKPERRDEQAKKKAVTDNEADKNLAKDQATRGADDYYKNDTNNRAVAANTRRAQEQAYRNQTNNIFRGRVTDANNVGVPFANVTNVEDKAGTYTDANGYFNLTSPDTALTVQVRSIGFENSQIQLRNALPNNQVVLQDDRKSLSEVVISNQKPNAAARNRDANKTLEEPVPADGWDNYDAYLVNNLEVPDELKTKQKNSGSVQISFEVDKHGEPVNIRVEKSLCSNCDKEAIRLVKDGPKWKRTANKKGRTTVTINF